MPGFEDLQHIIQLDIPDRYLVVRTLWQDTPVYFHNVYAPVQPHLRQSFFEALPRDFEHDSVHLVGGDFNIPFEAALDASIPRVDGNTGKAECFEWLTALRVVDPWRIHHPHERVYSGPGRCNRLDYLLVDHDLMACYYKDAQYSKNVFGGDHLQHVLTLSNGAHDQGRGQWRLPKELLSNPNIVNAIKEEATRLLDAMCVDENQNFGAMWYGWLKRMKKRLQTCHRHHLQHWKDTLHQLKLAWLAARQNAADDEDAAGRIAATRDAYDTTKSEYEQLLKDQQFDFHANVNERGTSHFFRRPRDYKVPICTATIDGVAVTDKAAVQAAFTDHWKSIMTSPVDGPQQINRAQRRAVLRGISKRLTPVQREELDSPITDAELCASLKTMKPNKSPGCPLSCLLFVFYLEPLGEMLRAQPQHGIELPSGDIMTSIFFADDSTLLSNSLPAAVAQMEIVDEFCSVSGARLNQRKCMTLVLNDHLDPADIEADELLNILPSGQPAKYLGVLFGHRLPVDFQVQILRDKFLAAFPMWGGRARTLQGRKLLVSTMLLSMLWHVTTAVPIPQHIVDEIQSMTNKFIVGRKTLRTDKFRALLDRPLQHDKAMGLGIPHIASIIRQQRLARLQQLMANPSGDGTPSWRPLVHRQFARVMGQLYRDSYPFDFLFYFPNMSSKWIALRELHPLWRDVWKQWSAIPMSKRVETPPTFDMVMNMPLWLTSYEPMHYGRLKYSACLASAPNIRRWCLQGASNGLRSLKDFLNTDGSWPTQAMFISRMSQGNPAARVRLNAARGRMEFTAIERAVPIYLHLTQVYEQVRGLFNLRAGARSPGIPRTNHPFFGTVKETSQCFCSWPKKKLFSLAYHAPPVTSHPAKSATRVTPEDWTKYMRFVRRACRAPTPVQGDVWLRLILHMLPVNSRFAYKQLTDPEAITCVYGCGNVETEHHAFHTCNEVFPTWQFHARAWRWFGVHFDWATISNIDSFNVSPTCAANKPALFKLWTLLTASVLHTIWTQHNAIKYDGKTPWPQRVWEETTFIGWMAAVRRWLRLQDPTDALRINVLAQLAKLKRQRPYNTLWLKYPNCLILEFSAPTP
ncbi:hypothetical protein DYB38_006892 [Aphanomyces astaci]|uniref:Reverse transcriptase domain-containing protein n=1 Tax=Aphanomyces astaci TaxID=112090 RepID=A0A397C5U8_APHAT|nr:hypothetical protein DYB38_006892 [Aphanomyces astaci]